MADGVARIQNRAADDRAHHRQIFQRHLRRAVLADAHADVRADELDVRLRNSGDADLVVSAREKCGERGCERHFAARAETGGHADHVLLGDVTFGGTFGKFFEKFVRERGIFCVAVNRNDALIHFADSQQRVAVGFARGNGIAEFVIDRRIICRRDIFRFGQLIRRGNRNADSGFCARLKFGDCFCGFFLVQRFAVPAVLVLQK